MPNVVPLAPMSIIPRLPIFVLSCASLLTSSCASRITGSGGQETHMLGGVVTVTTNSFQPITPAAAMDVDTSKLVGRNGPSGNKVSILWGLINLHDY